MSALDFGLLGAYLVLLVATGVHFARREQKDTEDYFLGGRRMPVWAVAVSVLATSMSAASFVGVPEAAYNGDLTYLSTNIGMVLAAAVVALVFIPAFYAARVQSIYELVGLRLGARARLAASGAFILGRVMASGARIYIAAIPLSFVAFGDLAVPHLMLAVVAMSVVGIAYTLVGGISSVIWTDVVQMGVLLGAVIAAIVLLLMRAEAPIGELIHAASVGGAGGGSKLTVFDLSLDPSRDFSLLAAVIGFTVLGIGSYGTDQDLAQRMLTCRSAKRGAWSAFSGIVIGIPAVALFLVLGVLLWLFYQRPELMGAGDARIAGDESTAGQKVFVQYIVTQMPAGLPGLMLAGLFAAGISSLNSAINAISSSFVSDIYRKARPGRGEGHYLKVGRLGVVVWGLVLGGFAALSVVWQRGNAEGLIPFALGVMTFAYAGLVGVFVSMLVLRRGSEWSAIAALLVGFGLIAVMQPAVWGRLTGAEMTLAFPWRLTLAVVVTTAVCAAGGRIKLQDGGAVAGAERGR